MPPNDTLDEQGIMKPSIDTDALIDELARQLYDANNNEADDLTTRLREAHASGTLLSTEALEARGEIIQDPNYAEELYLRHKILCESQSVAKAILLTYFGKGGKLSQLSRKLPKEGAFLEADSLEHYRKILTDPLWVIAHAGGKIRDPSSMNWRNFRFVSDMQVQMPADDPRAPLVTTIPNPKDKNAYFHDAEKDAAMRIAREIHDNHAIAACITNVGVYPLEYRQMLFGSLARQTAIGHIQAQINSARRNPIRYLIANTFRIMGLRVPTLPAPQLMLRHPIINRVSIIMHACSSKFDAILAWRTPGKNIPVECSLKDKKIDTQLLMNWESIVMSINEKR